MKQVEQYIRKNHVYMDELFNSMGKQQQLQATKVFQYMQQAFIKQECKFLIDGQDFLQNDQNSTYMENLIQNYCKKHNPDHKFYLYRIKFTFEELGELIQFWLENQPKLTVQYDPGQEIIQQNVQIRQKGQSLLKKNYSISGNKPEPKQQQKIQSQVNAEIQKVPELMNKYQNQLKQIQLSLQRDQLTTAQKRYREYKIKQLTTKLKVLNNRINSSPAKSIQQSQKSTPSISKKSETISLMSIKKLINYRAMFQFYAKHLTGAKATFGRIQHQIQTINYQKLVHFLRQYDLFPSNNKKQKCLHLIYIKCSSSTRDLNFQGFVKLLKELPDILYDEGNLQQKQLQMNRKLYEKNKIHKNKLLNYPFHSPQKDDFRIKSNDIKYQFKLIPQKGKLHSQIIDELYQRKQSKQLVKQHSLRLRQQKQRRYLRKIRARDPFDPLVLNNPLLQKSQQIQPIANLDNMQKYRDNSFDMNSYFGINGNDDIMREVSASINVKIKKLQKLELDKMNNLMNGIIERSQAKLQKMGYSPKSPKK